MQMLNTLDSIVEKGIDASKLDYWSRDDHFDILHLWGVSQHNFHIINWAKKSKKLIVATVLVPYFDTLRLKLSHWKHYFTDTNKQMLYNYTLIDKFIVLNELQSEVLTRYYNVPPKKITIIPNIVEESYFKKPEIDFTLKYNISNYILCTGNISRRKNQYNLALACLKYNLNLVMIGNILQGEEEYAQHLIQLVDENDNLLWIKELHKGSEDLVAAYYSCIAFALPSLEETQPISLLEATAAQKPIVTLNKAYSNQKYYKNAIRSDSQNFNSIGKALLIAIQTENYNSLIQECRSINVAKSYEEVYRSLIDSV